MALSTVTRIGVLSLVARRLSEASTLYSLNESAGAAQKVAQAVGVFAVGAVTGDIVGIKKPGLDRVFDSILKNNKTLEGYIEKEIAKGTVTDISAALLADASINYINDNNLADEFFDPIFRHGLDPLMEFGEFLGASVYDREEIIQNIINQIDNLKDSATQEVIQSAQEAESYFDDLWDDVSGGLNDGLNDIFSGLERVLGDFIDDVQDFFDRAAEAVFRRIDPLILDLDGDGLELTALADSNVKFDLDANGFAETASWVSADDGLLVLDRNGNGSIDNGTELFGDHTPIDSGDAVATDGFAAISDLDSNSDGIIDASDQQFSELRIWQDTNQDGKSDVTELSSLTDLGIVSINLNSSSSSQVINGNDVTQVSTFTKSNGITGEIGNVSLQSDQVNSEFVGDYQLTLYALLSPLARGYGNVADLHVAASQNADLLTLVQDFSSIDVQNSSESLSPSVEAIILEWAGTTGVDPDSRGTMFDARKLEALETFLSTDFVNTMGNGMPMMANVADLDNAWDSLFDHVLATLAVQSFGDDIYSSASYSFSTDTVSFGEYIGVVVAELKDNQPADTSSAAAYWLNNYRILNASANSFTADVGAAISDALDGTSLEALAGQLGNEYIAGSSGNDALTSNGSSNSILTAGAGNDTLSATSGNNLLYGGAGSDALSVISGTNVLDGGAGDDTLTAHSSGTHTFIGGTGNDTLNGSRYANDTYQFNLGDGQDVINEDQYYSHTSNEDRIIFRGIELDELWFNQAGSDLAINHIDSDDQVIIKNWYSSSIYQVETIQVGDSILLSNKVNQLVQAMAATSSGVPGSIDDLTAQQQEGLNSAIAAAWQIS